MTPLEVARAYAAGEISRDECVDQLATYPYSPGVPMPPESDLQFQGEVRELAMAAREGAIDYEMYEEIVVRLGAAWQAQQR